MSGKIRRWKMMIGNNREKVIGNNKKVIIGNSQVTVGSILDYIVGKKGNNIYICYYLDLPYIDLTNYRLLSIITNFPVTNYLLLPKQSVVS